MAKYIIRDVKQDDIEGIVRLRHSISEFRPIDTEEYTSFWNSLIKTNPSADTQVLIAENEQGEIVGHYAMVPFSFLNNEEELVGGFLCQLMVHEDYRKELIFPKMETKFIRGYKKLGYAFAFSLGNREKVVKAHLSFGFKKIGDLPVYARPYKLASIARRKIKSGIVNAVLTPGFFIAEKLLGLFACPGRGDIEVTGVPEFDPETDQFLTDVQKHFPCSALRNSGILNWRFKSASMIRYQRFIARKKGDIVGYAVTRRMDMSGFDVLAVVDILFAPGMMDAGKALLNAVHKMAVELNVEMSACLMSPLDPILPALTKCGYFKTPESFSLFVHESRGGTQRFSEDSFDRWHITWFDNDAV